MANYTCFEVADYFVHLANKTGSPITNLKLQKLVYYAQAWHLALYEEPLFDEDFQAWVHGPVIYKLWNKYTSYRYLPIEDEADPPPFDERTLAFLGELCDEYFAEDAYALERMTHAEDPWIKARGGIAPDVPCSTIIPKKSMQEYFQSRLA